MDEQERKRFEEWARPDSVQMRRNPETGDYTERGMSAAWAGWQAAVKVEREACARTCEALWDEEAKAAVAGTQEPKYHDCIECAHAIRERSNA